MTSCYIIVLWHEWNANTNDVMMMWFTLYVNLVMSLLACAMHVCTYDTHALCRTSASKYFSGLVCFQTDPNLAKITASHFQVLNAQNAN